MTRIVGRFGHDELVTFAGALEDVGLAWRGWRFLDREQVVLLTATPSCPRVAIAMSKVVRHAGARVERVPHGRPRVDGRGGPVS